MMLLYLHKIYLFFTSKSAKPAPSVLQLKFNSSMSFSFLLFSSAALCASVLGYQSGIYLLDIYSSPGGVVDQSILQQGEEHEEHADPGPHVYSLCSDAARGMRHVYQLIDCATFM